MFVKDPLSEKVIEVERMRNVALTRGDIMEAIERFIASDNDLWGKYLSGREEIIDDVISDITESLSSFIEKSLQRR